MANFSNQTESDILTHQFRTSTWAKPTVLAIALTTGASSASALGTEVSNSNGYARVLCNPLDANWTLSLVSGNYQITNANNIVFSAATGSWGTVTGIGILDSATYGAGTLRFFGPLGSSQVIATNNQFEILAGSIVLTLS